MGKRISRCPSPRARGTEGDDDAIEFDVWLEPSLSRTVRVTDNTGNGTAQAPGDYQTRSGRLEFAPGETRKTVRVPIVNDAVEDNGETFRVVLSNAQGARIARATATGTIFNSEEDRQITSSDPLTGITLVDGATGAEVGRLASGATVTLDEPQDGSYGFRIDTRSGAETGSVETQLLGPTTASGTDNDAPYTLPASGGTALPAGSYTVSATAYPEADAAGDGMQTLTISFTVEEAEVEPAPLSATFTGSRYQSASHSGADDTPQVVVSFSEPVADIAKTTPSVRVRGGSVKGVQRHTLDGPENTWLFYVTPAGDGDVRFALVADAECDAGEVCTPAGTRLSGVPAPRTVPGPGEPVRPQVSAADAAADEDDGTLTFEVTLSPAAAESVTVDYATSDDSARAGTDYTATRPDRAGIRPAG